MSEEESLLARQVRHVRPVSKGDTMKMPFIPRMFTDRHLEKTINRYRTTRNRRFFTEKEALEYNELTKEANRRGLKVVEHISVTLEKE